MSVAADRKAMMEEFGWIDLTGYDERLTMLELEIGLPVQSMDVRVAVEDEMLLLKAALLHGSFETKQDQLFAELRYFTLSTTASLQRTQLVLELDRRLRRIESRVASGQGRKTPAVQFLM